MTSELLVFIDEGMFNQRAKMIENVLQFGQCQLVFSVFLRTLSANFFFPLGQFCQRVTAKKESDNNQK